MAESLISRFGCREIKRDAGIPEGVLEKCLKRLVSERGRSLMLGRVILASRLHYFHAIDQDWTRSNLIANMSWQDSEEAEYLWRGYLWRPRISADLLIDLKANFLQTIQNISLLRGSKKHFFQLIAIILFQRPDAFTRAEQTEILRNIGSAGRAEVSDFFLGSFRDNKTEEENELFWSNRLRPLFKRVWPKDASSIDKTTSQYLVRIAIRTGKKFPEAAKEFEHLVGPFPDIYPIIRDLKDSVLPKEYPTDVLRLLDLVFTDDWRYPTNDFRKIMDQLIKRKPELAHESAYQRIDRYLLEHSL